MALFVVDYSREHYEKRAGGPAPPERHGKFIQVRGGDAEYLVFSIRELHRYHADIARTFLASRGVRGAYNQPRHRFESREAGWRVLGGGLWSVDEGRKVLELSGNSSAYGKYRTEGLAAGLRRVEGLGDYTIVIR
ncbi:MAG: hypothetical protein P8Y75_02320 [Nitrospirota bacterium]|jgi:hypothetical protein